MLKSSCPVCQSDVVIDDEAILGDMVTCTNCECDLEILTLHPLQIAEIKDTYTEEQ